MELAWKKDNEANAILPQERFTQLTGLLEKLSLVKVCPIRMPQQDNECRRREDRKGA